MVVYAQLRCLSNATPTLKLIIVHTGTQSSLIPEPEFVFMAALTPTERQLHKAC